MSIRQTVSEHETVRNRSCLNKSNNLVSKMQAMSFRSSNSPPEIQRVPKNLELQHAIAKSCLML